MHHVKTRVECQLNVFIRFQHRGLMGPFGQAVIGWQSRRLTTQDINGTWRSHDIGHFDEETFETRIHHRDA